MVPPHALRGVAPRGFTLLEILVVLAIIGLLVGLAVAHIHRLFSHAQADAAQMFVRESVKTPLFLYARDVGGCPSTSEGLQALLVPPSTAIGRWRGPYLSDTRALTDPWGRPYQYRVPPTKSRLEYDLYSLGPDGIESPDDIGNW